MKKEKMTFGLDIKEMKSDDAKFFTFEGYLSTFALDLGNDRVMPGAFRKTIQKWEKSGGNMPVLWQHNMAEPIGVFTEMREDAVGLFVKARLPKADEFVAKRVIPQIECGSIKAMSIGYRAEKYSYEKEGYIRNLEEIDLFEGSAVTMPMNPQAAITGFKNIQSFKSAPIADHAMAWDAEAALGRVTDAGVLADAHLWASGESFKFLIADLVDGKLTIVPKALAIAAAQIQIGDDDIPDEEVPAIKFALGRYYQEMGRENPFQEKDCVHLDFAEQLTPREIERILRKGVSFSQSEAKRIVKLIAGGQREVEPKADREDQKDLNSILEALKKFQ